MARACVFCRSTKHEITKEHVLASWLTQLYAGSGIGLAEIVRRDGAKISYPLKLFQQTVRKVCGKCNNGWMATLEGQVKSILGPMMHDNRQTKISLREQKLIATWAVKTAFMLDHLHPAESIVPASEYHRLYAAQQPPAGYLVWLAQRNTFYDSSGRELLAASRHQFVNFVNATDEAAAAAVREGASKGHVVFVITFAIGYAVFQVFGHNFPGSFEVAIPPINATQLVWPVQPDASWPPAVPIDHIGGFEGLHNAFNPPQAAG